MRLVLLVSVASSLAIAAAGCGTPAPDPGSSGGQTAMGGASGASGGGATSGGMSPGGATSGGAAQGGAAQGGATSGGAAQGGAAKGGAGAGGGSTVGYAKDAQPIFKARCGTCHGGTHVHNNIAVNYADAKKPVESLQFDECWENAAASTGPKTLGECSMILARSGKMPIASGCDAPTPFDPSLCLTQAEKDTLAAWVAGGMAP